MPPPGAAPLAGVPAVGAPAVTSQFTTMPVDVPARVEPLEPWGVPAPPAPEVAEPTVSTSDLWADVEIETAPGPSPDPWATTIEDAPSASIATATPWGSEPPALDLTTESSWGGLGGDATVEDTSPVTEVFDDSWGDGDAAGDADRSEIEALIAQAEAEAAGALGSMPLTFTEPEGVDLRAIVASEPQEPPLTVLDAVDPALLDESGSKGPRESPDWLTSLVGSIDDAAEEETKARPAKDAEDIFVHSDSVIRAPRKKLNLFAAASFLTGLVWLCGLGSLAAIGFAVIALTQISTSHQRGKLLAILGLVFGVVGATAALVLFVFDGSDSNSPTVVTEPVALGEVTVSSCALNPNGTATAVVRIVNPLRDALSYEITVAFVSPNDRAVEVASRPDLGPGDSDTVTVVTESRFDSPPDCRIQDTVRYESDG